MNSTFRSSESLPSLHSFQSLQKRFNESRHSSIHFLAYLAHESTKSMKSIASHEMSEVIRSEDVPPSGPLACPEAWWSDLIDLKPFTLRPLSNFGVNRTPSDTLTSTNRTEPPHFSAAPPRPRRRPPPLELDPRIVSSRKENVAPSSAKLRPKPKPSPKDPKLDSSSPWGILNQFPTPPATPSIIRGYRTSTSLHKIARSVNDEPPPSAPLPKRDPQDQVEDQSTFQVLRKKRHSSFGSLGKVFKTTPCTPPPLPPAWLRSDPMSGKESETNSPSGLQRRDTFKSKLFSIGASPKASPRVLGAGDRRLPSQASGYTITRQGNRAVSESARKSLVLRQNLRPIGPRSRSVSQPAQSKDKGELGTPRRRPSEDIPPLPIDLEKHLIIPERRTQSPSYINLYVPPWKQVSTSPTQISFPLEGGVPSAPVTPIGGGFEIPDQIMHLPTSGSVSSLKAELDPFGAGEPNSFFRSEYGVPKDTIEIDQATLVFYSGVNLEITACWKRRLLQRAVETYDIPDIVISSSGGLEELKRRKWMFSD